MANKKPTYAGMTDQELSGVYSRNAGKKGTTPARRDSAQRAVGYMADRARADMFGVGRSPEIDSSAAVQRRNKAKKK